MRQAENQIGFVHINITVLDNALKTLDAYRIFHNVAAFNSSHANHADANIIQTQEFSEKTTAYLYFSMRHADIKNPDPQKAGIKE